MAEFVGVLQGTDTPKEKNPCVKCPLNSVPGVRKVFGSVEGKKIFIWGLAPGPEENRAKKEFIGRSGELLWRELGRVGIEREDCDIQNVVRCYPSDYDDSVYPPLKMRNPTKIEIKCCSAYNEPAIKQSKAKVHLVFGEIAAKSLLGAEYGKAKKIFWSYKLDAQVVCLYHPSYFLRMGYGSVKGGPPPNRQLKEFRQTLDYVVETILPQKSRFSYIESQDYFGITTRAQADEAEKEIREYSEKGRRIAVDIEDGVVPELERTAILVIGFSPRKGRALVFCLDHRTGVNMTNKTRKYLWDVVKRILEDPNILKAFHHGSYDLKKLWEIEQIEVRGFDYDTSFGEYFSDPEGKAFGLTSITNRRYPEFGNYKEILLPEVLNDSFRAKMDEKKTKLPLGKQFEMARKIGALDMSAVPLDKMVVYNGADCDITKRIEVSTKKAAPIELMRVYKDASIVLAKMEESGPLFDYQQCDKLMEWYPKRVRKWKSRLRRIAENPNFNPASPEQVKKLLFDFMQLEMPEWKDGESSVEPNTRAETLEMMEDQSVAPRYVLNYRADAKIESTYLKSFRLSADMHEGRLATKWWLTGTRTGRLSSGKGREAETQEKGLVNLQNIVSNANLQNMVISTNEWRELYRWWKKNGPFTKDNWEQWADIDVLLGFDEAQFEIRVVAQRSGDKELIATFERDEDIHAEVGYKLLKLPKEKLMEEGPERVAVKGMHFGIIYGLKAKSLHANIVSAYKSRGIKDVPTIEWVQNLLDEYFRRYEAVKLMIEADQKQAEKYGWVETMFGFRRPLNVEEQKELGDAWTGAYWANQAANTPIQGTAHQLLLHGLAQLVRQPAKYRLLQRSKMEVHDAMYFFVKLKNLWAAIAQGKSLLEEEPVRVAREEFNLDWRVPLKAEPKAGFRFGVQVKNLGMKNGPATVWDFLNAWCEKNKKVEIALKEEMLKIS